MIKGVKKENEFVKWFSELSNKDIAIAGGKGASLAEMYVNKFPIPPGFIVTAQAFRHFIDGSGLNDKIRKALEGLDMEDTSVLQKASDDIRKMIEETKMPKELEDAIIEAYDVLDVDKSTGEAKGTALDILRRSHEPPFVAVRSSATAEDLADASFAGQQDSFLNVKGNRDLIEKVKKCFSSLFTARAIYYRANKGFDSNKVSLAAVVQIMIDSEKSGVMFSRNPIAEDETIVIEAVWGLGEGIVSGMIKPDHYVINRDLEKFKITNVSVADKKVAVVRDSSGDNKVAKLNEERSKQRVLENSELKRLSQYALQLEEHYGKPQDIEFAIANKELYIVQSRPITTLGKKKETEEIGGKVLLSGYGASPGVGSGVVKIVHNLEELSKIKKGDVLVTVMTNPDMVMSMQKAAAIITDEGGVTSHAAIVSREMGIPAIVGTNDATTKLVEGQIVTVDAFKGVVIEGKGHQKLVEILPIVKTKTKIKVIVDLPQYAARAALSEAKGVGLVRLEGIIATSGKHPMYYVKKDKLTEYVSVLYHGLKKIAEPFEEIWVRTSDIRSDEYTHLDGAPKHVEGNPMLGDHGIRYSLKNKGILESEFKAIKSLAEEFQDKKFGIMMPQIISVDEIKEANKIIDDLKMPENVKIGIMVETPAAVMMIEDLCKEGIKFISFGTNDLTQYVLAVDRNNTDVQNLYNEMHPAVLSSISYVINVCKKYKVETSLCGQSGSKEEMVRFLIAQGIDSISLNADVAKRISELIAELEEGNYHEPVEKLITFDMNEKETEELSRKSEKIENKTEQGGEMYVPVMQQAVAENVDIEDVVLKALGDEYMPGIPQGNNNDIPPLGALGGVIEDQIIKEEIKEAENIIIESLNEKEAKEVEDIMQNSGDEEEQKELKEWNEDEV